MEKKADNHLPPDPERLRDSVFSISDRKDFESVALEVFRYQASACEVYKKFISLLGIRPEEVKDVASIPYLPIELFRDAEVIASGRSAEIVFRSSQTTGTQPSQHFVADRSMYDKSLLSGFNRFYGNPSGYAMLALLPTYLERSDASLVYMMQRLMEASGHPLNGFFLKEYEQLHRRILQLKAAGQPYLLTGVTFALLDFSERFKVEAGTDAIIIETGGMKGRRKEIVREELHELLCSRFGVKSIHSEYGMTELLSQAWSKGAGIYHPVPWMDIRLKDLNDPFQAVLPGRSGVIHVIDLANLYSCSFIATRDLGRMLPGGGFEVLGRVDNSDVRGCSLMAV